MDGTAFGMVFISGLSVGVLIGYFLRCLDEAQMERRNQGIEPCLRRERRPDEDS